MVNVIIYSIHGSYGNIVQYHVWIDIFSIPVVPHEAVAEVSE